MAFAPEVRVSVLATGLAVVLAGPGCIEISGSNFHYTEREDKHFTITGKAEVTVSTFDGSIQVHPWDRPEVEVIIEKRAGDKRLADEIDIHAEQNGDHVTVEVRSRKRDGHINF